MTHQPDFADFHRRTRPESLGLQEFGDGWLRCGDNVDGSPFAIPRSQEVQKCADVRRKPAFNTQVDAWVTGQTACRMSPLWLVV